MSTLEQAAEFLSGGTPKKGVPEYWDGDIPWYSASNMDRRFLCDGEPKITKAGLEAGSRLAPQGATLLLVRGSGLFNRIPICFADQPVAFNQDVKAICAKPHVDPTFLHFWIELLRKDLTDNIGVTGIGAGKFDTDFLKGLPFPDLIKKEQEKIGLYASSFDRRIDLNRQMNNTLEMMARAIFKDWFIDFGPTRAKLEGREPYLDPKLWSLFPERLDHEGKPEGWKVLRLDQIAEHCKGTASPASEPDRIYEHYSLPAFDNGQEPVVDLGASIKSNKTPVPEGAILLSKLNPEIKRVWLTHKSSGTEQIASTEFLAFKPKGPVSRSLLFCLFSDPFFRQTLQGMVTGTSKSHQRVSPPALMALDVIVGDDQLFEAFEEKASPLLERVLANRVETRFLAQTRVMLLPKLISGEISLKVTEQQVVEAT